MATKKSLPVGTVVLIKCTKCASEMKIVHRHEDVDGKPKIFEEITCTKPECRFVLHSKKIREPKEKI